MSHREKSENRRALPKFLLILLGSLVLGAGLGVLVALADFSGGGEAAARVLRELLRRIAPWGIPALAAVLGGGGLILYLRAWGRANRWDGEDEEEAEAVENLLDWVLLCSSALLVASFFFFAVGVCFELGLMETVLPFILSIALVILLQQKAVDLTKRMNPEKKGSVYDTKFQKKWYASCDEAERAQIGQAAMTAFRAVNGVCLGLWLVLVTLGMAVDLGLLPVCLVSLIWGVSQLSYIAACIRMTHRRVRE